MRKPEFGLEFGFSLTPYKKNYNLRMAEDKRVLTLGAYTEFNALLDQA